MKIRPLVLLAAAAALSSLSGCTTRPVHPLFGLLSIDTLLGGGAPECRVEYRFATIVNAGDSPALAAIEQANIGYFFELEDFSGTARDAAAVALHEIKDDYLSGISAERTYEISAEAEGIVVDTLITYAITRSSYLGGAHGMYGTECHNYTLRDGYELSTADLFTDEQLQALNRLIRAKLCERYQARNDEELTAAGFFPEDIGSTENFRVTPEGLTFYYNPYDIGCYALGPVEVDFSREEIERIRQ